MSEDFVENLPEKFKKIALAMPHFDGEKWLNELPYKIHEIEDKWSLKVEKHFPNLSYNYVASCVLSDGKEAVLKIGMPEEDSELFYEARILKHLNGNGAVKLLKVEKELEILLLEKINPGKSLKQVFESEKSKSIEVAIKVLQRFLMTSDTSEDFPKLEKWFEPFESKRRQFPLQQFSKTSRLIKKLNGNAEKHQILHADFHHDNILSSDRDGFLTIDAKGMVGNVGYDIAVFLNNHAIWIRSETNYKKQLKIAVEQFAEAFELPTKFIKQWAFAQQVLSAWWHFEDGWKGWQDQLQLADVWEEI